MGRDKGSLCVEGQPLLARQLALARAVGAEEVFISGRPEVDYSQLGYPVLLDVWRGCGPLGGIERALASASHKLVLVLAVDLPYLGVNLLKRLVAACADEIGLVPVCEQRLEPLVALYPSTAHPIALSLLEEGRCAAREFAERCRRRNLIRMLRFEPVPHDFTDWNTPQDAGSVLSAR